jgi:hypothetical protein
MLKVGKKTRGLPMLNFNYFRGTEHTHLQRNVRKYRARQFLTENSTNLE